MENIQIAVQWLHVLGGIFWFGGTMFMNFVIVPAVRTMPVVAQKEFGVAVGRTARIVLPIGYTTIALGAIRGTVFGPVKDLDILFGTELLMFFAIFTAMILMRFGV